MTTRAVVVQTDPLPLDNRATAEHPAAAASEGAGMLWYGMLGPPLLTLLNLQIAYSVTPLACKAGSEVAMDISSAILFALVIVAGIGCAMRLHSNWLENTVMSRPGYMAMLGVLESVLFGTVMIAQWLPHAFLTACQ